MADLSWMRLLGGQRSRTPVRPSSSSSCSESAAPLPQSHTDVLSQHSAVRAPPGLTSWHCHGRPLPAGARSSTSANSTGDLLVNEADRVWHNPSVDQMVDALRVAMMTKPALEALDPRYNAYVLHLVEGYGHLQARLLDAEQRLSDAELRRQREADQLLAKADDWIGQESRYKAEIKRLEVLIHRSSGNSLEAVVMARANSLVCRTTKLEPEPDATTPGAGGSECMTDFCSLSEAAEDMAHVLKTDASYSSPSWRPSRLREDALGESRRGMIRMNGNKVSTTRISRRSYVADFLGHSCTSTSAGSPQ